MKLSQVTVAVVLGTLLAGTAVWAAPFGGPEDVEYAAKLWKAMKKAKLVGAGAIQGTPYTGQHPHGAILDTLDSTVKVGGKTGAVIVKRNYGGKGVSKQAVANDPGKYLKAVTVMYKRNGYDPENGDWFWVKYKPDGGLHTNPKGMKLAGRVAKGAKKGCIACHKAAPGGDFVFNNNRIK
ncbi:MAG: cytochrome P460 family protein [Acidiferrobacterales bacterium]